MNEHWTQQHIESNKDTSPIQLWMQFVGMQLVAAMFILGIVIIVSLVLS